MTPWSRSEMIYLNFMNNSIKVVYFGTPDFAATVLSYLLEKGIDVVAVVTKPDKPKGRSGVPVATPVKQVAEAHKIVVHQPQKASSPEFAATLQQYDADLFVVVAYGEILRPHLLAIPKKGCINLHASLLPKYRGAAPIQRSIIAGEAETGVTIMHMVEKMDAGDMIEGVKVPIGIDTTYGDLEKALCTVGSRALWEVIQRFEKGPVTSVPQDHTKMTLAPKIELEECQIDWQKPAQSLHNLVRGVNPEPGAWTKVFVKEKPLRLKINRTKVHERSGPSGITPGTILAYGKEGFIVACGEGALELLDVQLEGKRAMSAQELMRGIPKEQVNFSIQKNF